MVLVRSAASRRHHRKRAQGRYARIGECQSASAAPGAKSASTSTGRDKPNIKPSAQETKSRSSASSAKPGRKRNWHWQPCRPASFKAKSQASTKPSRTPPRQSSLPPLCRRRFRIFSLIPAAQGQQRPSASTKASSTPISFRRSEASPSTNSPTTTSSTFSARWNPANPSSQASPSTPSEPTFAPNSMNSSAVA